MFSIVIHVKSFVIYGLKALDTRRRLKLPDASSMTVNSGPGRATVSEGFARAHFPSQEVAEVSQFINFDHLTPEDVRLDERGDVELRPDLPAARVQELWLSAHK